MKRILIIIGAVALLLIGILMMVFDLFFDKSAKQNNPYAYNLSEFRTGDTTRIMFDEIRQIKPKSDVMKGVATGKSGHIYLCGDAGVEVFDSSGKSILSFPTSGTGSCIAVGGDQIFLGMQDRVEIYSASGRLVKSWKVSGREVIITSLAVHKDGIFIADAGDKVVYHCDFDGNLLKKIGEKDPARKIPGFVIPSPYFDVAVDPSGCIWVANAGRHSLEKYNDNGDLLLSWGESTMAMEGFCGCCNPSNFALMADGSFVTSEKGIERVKVYTPGGKFKWLVASPEAFIEGTRGLDLAVDPEGRIVLLDPEKRMIRIFILKREIEKPSNCTG